MQCHYYYQNTPQRLGRTLHAPHPILPNWILGGGRKLASPPAATSSPLQKTSLKTGNLLWFWISEMTPLSTTMSDSPLHPYLLPLHQLL